MDAAGKLNRFVTLERVTIAKNAFNEDVETWCIFAEVLAEKHDASARESYRVQEVGAEITARFRIRHSTLVADLNPRDRLTYRGKAYNIIAVRETKRNRWIEVDALARPDAVTIEVSP